MFNFFKKRTREEEMERTIGHILRALMVEDEIQFSHLEQSKILNGVFVRFKEEKIRQRTESIQIAENINKSIEHLSRK